MNVKIVIALAMEYLSPFVSFASFCFCFICLFFHCYRVNSFSKGKPTKMMMSVLSAVS